MRECNSPQPQYGGRKCIGKTTDSDSCNKKVCPIGEHKLLFIMFLAMQTTGFRDDIAEISQLLLEEDEVYADIHASHKMK